MPFLKPLRVSFNKETTENAKRNGWRHAIFSTKRKTQRVGYYKGEWKNDKKEGKGMELDRDGWMYEGDWSNDKKHGYGVLSKVSTDGSIQKCYAGDWVAGKKQGFGSMWYENGSYYEGTFCENKRQGYGRIWYHDGRYYQGTWENDLCHGTGMLIEANGDRYEGEFVNGQREGCGIFYHINTGQALHGLWKADFCIRGTMVDTYWRQSAVSATHYPIVKNELREHKDVCPPTRKNEENFKVEHTKLSEHSCKVSTKSLPMTICVSKNTCSCLSFLLN